MPDAGLLSELHFLRPQWLWALVPVLLVVITLLFRQSARRRWRQFIAPHLLDHLVVKPKGGWRVRPVHFLCLGLILATLAAAGPSWQREPPPFTEDTAPLVIALDPNLSAVENAQSYFRRYEKSKAAVADLPRLIKKARLEAAYLEQLGVDLDLAGNRPEIDEVRTALADAGYAPVKRGSQPQRGQPLRRTSEDGLLILVGRSARQNHEVTFRRAAPDDLWLHAVDQPGSHVVVKSGGGVVLERTLLQAASLAAYYSAGRGESSVLVAYTERRYVRQIRGAGPGMVTYRHEKTVRVCDRLVPPFGYGHRDAGDRFPFGVFNHTLNGVLSGTHTGSR